MIINHISVHVMLYKIAVISIGGRVTDIANIHVGVFPNS